MDAGREKEYSALEVVSPQRAYQTSQQGTFLSAAEGEGEFAPHEGKQVCSNDGKEHMVNENDGMEVAEQGDHHHGNYYLHVRRFSSKKKVWILGGAFGLIAVLAVVLGSVLGSRHNGSAATTSQQTNPPNSTGPSSPSFAPLPAAPLVSQHNIAALSFASNNVNHTRVYFQDNAGQIMEASNSTGNPTWTINGTGTVGKNGSAIAAAVSRPNFPEVISIFYLDINNLIHDLIYTFSTNKWTSGVLSDQGYTAMPNSSLAALYNQCPRCANTTIIAFQDENGFVQIGNLTSDGWSLTQLGPTLSPEPGMGLALQPFYRKGLEDQINLYHQKSSGLNMSLSCWKPASINNGVPGWDLNVQVYDAIPSGSPIAAASSYSNLSNGYETWIQVLSVSNTGVQVSTWSGAINDWLEQSNHPSAMVNSSTATTDDNGGRLYGSVAVTAIGSAFGVVVGRDGRANGIEEWQVQDDIVDWRGVGNVDLGGSWG